MNIALHWHFGDIVLGECILRTLRIASASAMALAASPSPTLFLVNARSRVVMVQVMVFVTIVMIERGSCQHATSDTSGGRVF